MDYKPIVKCDIDAVLQSSEPPSVVRAWVKAIETIHPMRTNTGVPIRDAILLAVRTTRDPLVKKYLTAALRYYKGNAAGTTKFTALWLAIQVRRGRPELFTAAGMATPDPPQADGGAPPPEEEAMEVEEGDDDAAAAAAAEAEAEALAGPASTTRTRTRG